MGSHAPPAVRHASQLLDPCWLQHVENLVRLKAMCDTFDTALWKLAFVDACMAPLHTLFRACGRHWTELAPTPTMANCWSDLFGDLLQCRIERVLSTHIGMPLCQSQGWAIFTRAAYQKQTQWLPNLPYQQFVAQGIPCLFILLPAAPCSPGSHMTSPAW